MNGEFGISRCKLLYIEWVENKILLYSTGDYIQYRETYKAKVSEKEDICMYN